MTYTIFIYLYDGRLFFTGCLNLYFEKYKGIGPGYYDRPIMALPQNCSAEDVSAAIQHCVIEMEEHRDSIYQDNSQYDIMQMDKQIFQNFKLFGVNASRKKIIQQSIGVMIRKRENDFMLGRYVPDGRDMITQKKLYLPPDSSMLEVSQVVLELLG